MVADIYLYPGETNPSDIKLSDPTTLRSGGGGGILLASVVALMFTNATAPIQTQAMTTLLTETGAQAILTESATGQQEFDLLVQLESSKPLPFGSTGTIEAGFNSIRQLIINGLDSAQSETNGWDAKRSLIPVSAVVRTSDTVVTITLPAISGYDITAPETVTATIPGAALALGSPIVATPTFGIATGAQSGQVDETVTATATQTAQAVFSDTRAETLTASGTQTGLAVFAGARSETLTATDTETAQAVFSSTRAESLTVADSQDGSIGTVVHNVAVNETLSATATQTGLAVFVSARAETVTASDSETALALYASDRSESLSPADTQTTTAIFAATRAEVLSATDSQTGTVPAAGETLGAFTWRFQGGALMEASISGGSVLTAQVTGGPV